MQKIVLDAQLICDLELLLNGGFNPLTGFMTMSDYESVLDCLHLATGELWPIPIVLPASAELAQSIEIGKEVLLCDSDNTPLASLSVTSIWEPNREEECQQVFGTTDRNHPFVDRILSWPAGTCYLGGPVKELNGVKHFDFTALRRSPKQTKQFFEQAGWTNVVGFQTRNPMHRSHYELSLIALEEAGPDSKLLLQPVVGITQACDVDYHTRVRCYQHIIKYYPPGRVMLSLLPLSMRMAGPREALWHAIIRKNYGCTAFVVGRDHAGPSYKTKSGADFYHPYAAQNLLLNYADELGMKIIVSKNIVYSATDSKYYQEDHLPAGAQVLSISGTEQRRLLCEGEPIPEWFSFKEVVTELQKTYVPKNQRGLCIYLIGLSGSGKSTLAKAIQDYFLSSTLDRTVSILDGDVIRRNLSKGLGFSKEDRSTNVRRIGFVASEIVKHRGVVICANIAPYQADRVVNRQLIESQGGHYLEVWLNPSLAECQRRDVKGLYADKTTSMTGVGDPFEVPTTCDLAIDTETFSVEACLELIMDKLELCGAI